MPTSIHRFTFPPAVDLHDVEASLVLALWAAEALHGEGRVRQDAAHYFDADRRACVVDAGTAVGRDVSAVFLGFLRRQYGPAVRVDRVAGPAAA